MKNEVAEFCPGTIVAASPRAVGDRFIVWSQRNNESRRAYAYLGGETQSFPKNSLGLVLFAVDEYAADTCTTKLLVLIKGVVGWTWSSHVRKV